jgi:hypothetical protein
VTHVKSVKSLLAEVILPPSKKGIAGDVSIVCGNRVTPPCFASTPQVFARFFFVVSALVFLGSAVFVRWFFLFSFSEEQHVVFLADIFKADG